jgi:hypothetical protein
MRSRTLTTVLAGLTLAGLLTVSAAKAGAPVTAARPVPAAPAPKRARHLPRVEGCFEPPPEPVAPPPCTDDAAPVAQKRSAR